ncbi:MAG: SEC-C metal-binding domain-containing protein, partial [Planctomycetota bacterium]
VPAEEGGDCDQTDVAQVFDDAWVDRCRVERLQIFSDRKSTLPEQCVQCDFKRFCWGGCPKHRGKTGGELAPTVLCAGYQRLFEHALPRMDWLIGFIRRGQQPPPPGFDVRPPPRAADRPKAGPNDPCPCGSGRKFKKCCARKMG